MDGLKEYPDYIYSRYLSEKLARNIQNFYRRVGRKDISIYVVSSSNEEASLQTKGVKKVFYSIRSNIINVVPEEFRKKDNP